MLDMWTHQGKFAENYVRLLASAAGLIVYQDDPDYDGIDFGFRFPGRLGIVASPAVEIQVKSWSTPKPVSGEWRYDGLTERQFNKLAGDRFMVPRYLVLVIVPPDPLAYVGLQTEGMLIRQLAFYQSFADETPIDDPSGTRRRPVTVPHGNVLTVQTLQTLVHPELVTVRAAR